MKNRARKISLVFIAFCVCLFSAQIQAQEKSKHINFDYIISKLTSQTENSAEKVSAELIEKIRAKKVDFILSSEDEENLRNSGAGDLLIKAIDGNASEKVKQEIKRKLYFSALPDETGKSYGQNDKLIELGKQYIRVFGYSPKHKAQAAYLRKSMTRLEEELAKYKQEQELKKVLSKAVVKNIESDKLKKELTGKFIRNHTGNIEQQKIALEAAREFIEKFIRRDGNRRIG